MRTRLLGTIVIAGVLGATLVACASDPLDTVNGDDPAVNDTETNENGDTQADDDLGAGTAWIEVDGERYETRELSCITDSGGAQFAGDAEGPRENARIHGSFDTPFPDIIAVEFDRGDEGEFRALAENELLPHGVLEDYTFDSNALTMSGSAEFGWVDEEGESDLENLHPGTFQVAC